MRPAGLGESGTLPTGGHAKDMLGTFKNLSSLSFQGFSQGNQSLNTYSAFYYLSDLEQPSEPQSFHL